MQLFGKDSVPDMVIAGVVDKFDGIMVVPQRREMGLISRSDRKAPR